jgi:hypothetical protein
MDHHSDCRFIAARRGGAFARFFEHLGRSGKRDLRLLSPKAFRAHESNKRTATFLDELHCRDRFRTLVRNKIFARQSIIGVARSPKRDSRVIQKPRRAADNRRKTSRSKPEIEQADILMAPRHFGLQILPAGRLSASCAVVSGTKVGRQLDNTTRKLANVSKARRLELLIDALSIMPFSCWTSMGPLSAGIPVPYGSRATTLMKSLGNIGDSYSNPS